MPRSVCTLNRLGFGAVWAAGQSQWIVPLVRSPGGLPLWCAVLAAFPCGALSAARPCGAQ